MKPDVMITGWFICDGQSILTGIVCMRYPRSQKKCSAKGEDCEGRPIARVDVAVPGRWIGNWIRGWISGAAIGLADEPARDRGWNRTGKRLGWIGDPWSPSFLDNFMR